MPSSKVLKNAISEVNTNINSLSVGTLKTRIANAESSINSLKTRVSDVENIVNDETIGNKKINYNMEMYGNEVTLLKKARSVLEPLVNKLNDSVDMLAQLSLPYINKTLNIRYLLHQQSVDNGTYSLFHTKVNSDHRLLSFTYYKISVFIDSNNAGYAYNYMKTPGVTSNNLEFDKSGNPDLYYVRPERTAVLIFCSPAYVSSGANKGYLYSFIEYKDGVHVSSDLRGYEHFQKFMSTYAIDTVLEKDKSLSEFYGFRYDVGSQSQNLFVCIEEFTM